MWLDVELGARMKGLCPGVVEVTCGRSKWYGGVELGELALEARVIHVGGKYGRYVLSFALSRESNLLVV
jgi:hypothetical protein